jgi:hypothetical protein
MPKGLKAGGRKVGTPNRTTKQIRTTIADIIAGEIDRLKETLDSLEPQQRLYYLVKLLPFVVPKPISLIRSDLEPGGPEEGQQPIRITMDLGQGNIRTVENGQVVPTLPEDLE